MNLVFDVFALAVIVSGLVSWLWRRSRAKSARGWPTAEGTIESGSVEEVARVKGAKIELPVFAFSYQVGTRYFGGRFALLPYITDPGPSLVERMIGRKLQIRYDPQREDSWFIPEKLIEGCKVEQKLSPDLINFKPPI